MDLIASPVLDATNAQYIYIYISQITRPVDLNLTWVARDRILIKPCDLLGEPITHGHMTITDNPLYPTRSTATHQLIYKNDS